MKLLLDTNLLLLYLAGISREAMVGSHKRLKQFTLEDFYSVRDIVDSAKTMVLLPSILAETSNLARQRDGADRKLLMQTFCRLVEHAQERQIPAQEVVQPEFRIVILGYTDASILEAARQEPDLEILTVDLDLFLQLSAEGRKVSNFNHLREQFSD